MFVTDGSSELLSSKCCFFLRNAKEGASLDTARYLLFSRRLCSEKVQFPLHQSFCAPVPSRMCRNLTRALRSLVGLLFFLLAKLDVMGLGVETIYGNHHSPQ